MKNQTIFGCFDASQTNGYTETIGLDEFETVFPFKRYERGGLKPGVAYSCNFFLKMGYSTKY